MCRPVQVSAASWATRDMIKHLENAQYEHTALMCTTVISHWNILQSEQTTGCQPYTLQANPAVRETFHSFLFIPDTDADLQHLIIPRCETQQEKGRFLGKY